MEWLRWQALLVVGACGLALAAAPTVGSAQESGRAAGVRVGRDGARLLLVPAGEFIAGDDQRLAHEGPRRRVQVGAFYIDEMEVTNARYRRFLSWVEANSDRLVRHPDQPPGKDHTPRYWKPFRPSLLRETGMARLQRFDERDFRRDELPVVGVDWFDAYAYARWAGRRLPSEAEWEKAARGVDGRRWPWGEAWDFRRCNSGGYEWKGERDGHIYAAPVGSYPRGVSPYGCHDMAGNVAEWVADRYAPQPTGGPASGTDRLAGAGAPARVVKGGGSSSYPSWVRPAARRGREPSFRHFTLGFRCAAEADGERAAGARDTGTVGERLVQAPPRRGP